MLHSVLAVLFALASALTIAWGTVVKHTIAVDAPDGAPLRTAARSPLWWLATATALLAYAFQLIALSFGTLLIVQPILVLSLMFSLVLSAIVTRRRMSLPELGWSALLTISVGAVIVIGRPVPSDAPPATDMWVLALIIGGIIMAGVFRASVQMPPTRRALAQGLVCGAIFGYVAVLSKTVVEVLQSHGVSGLLTSWPVYALILAAILGTMTQQYAFHAGPLKNSLPAMKIAEPLVAFLLGYTVLKESFSADSVPEYLAIAVAIVTMVVSAFALARKGA